LFLLAEVGAVEQEILAAVQSIMPLVAAVVVAV
jgi:hypothetical protein